MITELLPKKDLSREMAIYGERLLKVGTDIRPISWDRDTRLKHWLSNKETQFANSDSSKLDVLFVSDIRSIFEQSLKRLVIQKSAQQIIDEYKRQLKNLNENLRERDSRVWELRTENYNLGRELKSVTFEYMCEVMQ